MKAALVSSVLATGITVANAQEFDVATENLAGDYAECAAYFELIYHGMSAANEEEAAAAYLELDQTAMFYALLLANEGRDTETAAKVTNSRIEMYMERMRRQIDNRNENISILINEHHFDCTDLMEDPPPLVSDLVETELEEAAASD